MYLPYPYAHVRYDRTNSCSTNLFNRLLKDTVVAMPARISSKYFGKVVLKPHLLMVSCNLKMHADIFGFPCME